MSQIEELVQSERKKEDVCVCVCVCFVCVLYRWMIEVLPMA